MDGGGWVELGLDGPRSGAGLVVVVVGFGFVVEVDDEVVLEEALGLIVVGPVW